MLTNFCLVLFQTSPKDATKLTSLMHINAKGCKCKCKQQTQTPCLFQKGEKIGMQNIERTVSIPLPNYAYVVRQLTATHLLRERRNLQEMLISLAPCEIISMF